MRQQSSGEKRNPQILAYQGLAGLYFGMGKAGFRIRKVIRNSGAQSLVGTILVVGALALWH